MVFCWNRQKERQNRKEHYGLSFAVARRVFYDPDCAIGKDRVVDGQQRWHALGFVPAVGAIVLVVHTVVYETYECIRIISAREAERWEQERYWEGDL